MAGQAALPALDASTLSTMPRDACIATITEHAKEWLQHSKANIAEDFLAERKTAKQSITQAAKQMDALLSWVMDACLAHFKAKAPCAIVSVGGYGRKELFPHSDVDILFLTPESPSEADYALIEMMLTTLWDSGLTLGHAVRSIDNTMEAAHAEHTIMTSLLDMRFICGKKTLAQKLRATFDEHMSIRAVLRAFVKDKDEEQHTRHQQWGDSRYILEPNIKEGKGAQRDLQTIYWMSKASYNINNSIQNLVKKDKFTNDEYRSYKRSVRFLWTVRMHLHLLAKRSDERMTFEMQRRIADAMGYRGETNNEAVERFMKRYFQVARDVGRLGFVIAAQLEHDSIYIPSFSYGKTLLQNKRLQHFEVQGKRLGFKNENDVLEAPLLMLGLFYHACVEGVSIHPRAWRLVSRHCKLFDKSLRTHPDAIRYFLAILQHSHHGSITLRRMSDAGLLERIFPDFARIKGQMQFDQYHIYTVDEHIITAVSMLHAIERGDKADELPLSTRLMPTITRKHVLYVAMLCHDIAKGRGGNHEEKGVPIARKFCKQMRFSKNDTQAVCWLVEQQELFITTAFKRDASDPATITRLAEDVSSVERLRLITLLSVADISAVGPKVWNGWKGALMRDLYERTEHYLQRGFIGSAYVSGTLAQDIEAHLDITYNNMIAEYIGQAEPDYLVSRSAEEHARLIHQMRSATETSNNTAISINSTASIDITELTVIAPDYPGFMSHIAGCVALAGVSILNARIYTLADGTAIQQWYVQTHDSQALSEEHDLQERLLNTITEHLKDTPTIKTLVAEKMGRYARQKKPFLHNLDIAFDNTLSPAATIVEITASDRIGLMHSICRGFKQAGINITSAHINTYGEKAVDVFYIRDRYGLKIDDSKTLNFIKRMLIEEIG